MASNSGFNDMIDQFDPYNDCEEDEEEEEKYGCDLFIGEENPDLNEMDQMDFDTDQQAYPNNHNEETKVNSVT